jgi:uncharacterized protein (DUF1778 family)
VHKAKTTKCYHVISYHMKNKRTALLIRCSVEQAERIRLSAKEESRTISAYVLKILMDHIQLKDRVQKERIARLRERVWRP